MRYIITTLSIFYLFIYQPANAQCGINILTNPSFETPVQPAIGNNLTGLTTWGGWTMTGGPFNVIRTNGSTYTGGPDNAQNGTQYIDITNGAGTIFQNFTIPGGSSSPVTFSGYFSSREQGAYINWTASIDIIDLSSNTVVSTSSTRLFTNLDGAVPLQENWYFLFGNAILPPGNYRYNVNLGNYGNFDLGSVSINCVLSTRITSFSANFHNNKNILKWKCEPSSNMSHFEIERSFDGNRFTTIGSTPYQNNLQFQWIDDVVSSENKYFYRLKMIDKDGSFKYSSTIIVKTSGKLQLELSPNPTLDHLRVNGLKGTGVINIYDVTGKRVITQPVLQSQTQLIDLSILRKGLYILEYINELQSEKQKFIKQ